MPKNNDIAVTYARDTVNDTRQCRTAYSFARKSGGKKATYGGAGVVFPIHMHIQPQACHELPNILACHDEPSARQRWAHLEWELIWNGNRTGTGTEKNQFPFLGPGARGTAGTGIGTG